MNELRVVHMPGRMGGEATIGDTRIDCLALADLVDWVRAAEERTRTIAGRVWAGDTVADLACEFGLARDQIRLACWWLVEHAVPVDGGWEKTAQAAWRAWSDQWAALAQSGAGVGAGDPPPRPEVGR